MENGIFQKIEEANKPDFGNILSKSFELFKKVWEQALYHVLMTMIVVIPMLLVIYIPYVLFVFNGMEYDSYGYYQEPELLPYLPFIILYGLIVLVVIFLGQAFVFGVTAHFYKVLRNEDTGSTDDVGGYFDLIKKDYKKLFMLSLMSFGIVLLAAILCYLPIFYVMVPIQLVVVMYAFNPELSATEIIKASFKLGNKFWLIIFGLVIISSMIAQVGIILCVVGVFFTAYFVHVPMYYVYKDTIGFEDVLDEIRGIES
jgi:hypothetical protein